MSDNFEGLTFTKRTPSEESDAQPSATEPEIVEGVTPYLGPSCIVKLHATDPTLRQLRVPMDWLGTGLEGRQPRSMLGLPWDWDDDDSEDILTISELEDGFLLLDDEKGATATLSKEQRAAALAGIQRRYEEPIVVVNLVADVKGE
jgi:hypothetical protein